MEYIETSSGNRISKKASISGAANILLTGNTTISHGVKLEGDVPLKDPDDAAIQVGKYSYFYPGSQVAPPLLGQAKGAAAKVYGPLSIGAFVVIGRDTSVQASNIGSRVWIGADCSIGNNSKVYHCCVIKDGTKIPEKYVVPPFSVVQGCFPDLLVGELQPGYRDLLESRARELYFGVV